MVMVRRHFLVSLSPRVLNDAFLAILDPSEALEVVQLEPGGSADGRFDVALVSAGTQVDARVVIELLDGGGCVIVYGDGADRVIDLRDAVDLVRVVGDYLAFGQPNSGDLGTDGRPAVGAGRDGDGAAD